MSACCEDESRELAKLRERQGSALRIVLVVSLVMFVLEFGAGLRARSTSLLGDSLDMLADASVYGFSLYVLHRSPVWRASAALIKGLLMATLGVGVLVQAAFRLQSGETPTASTMAMFAGLALAANALCFVLLYRHRTHDANLRSTWLCTRNDLIANVAVLVAAFVVGWTGSFWPDLIVGAAIAALFLRTSVTVVRDAIGELVEATRAPARARAPGR